MALKAIVGLVGIILVLGFLGVVVWKLPEIPLIVVILIGVAMMLYEYWEQLQVKEEEGDGS
ncbi:MAG: hypothetical protein Q8K18_01600 [Burkholderiales bacterium]|nr:hypothetical protein [Burkholderiales bacterium]